MWILPWNLPVVTQRNILTIFHMKPAVTWLKNAPLKLYKQGERREGERQEKQMVTVNKSFCKLLDAANNPHGIKRLQKYIWSPDQFPLRWTFSDMLLKLCAFKAARPIQTSGYGEVSSLHIHFIDTDCTLLNRHTLRSSCAFITHSYTHHT